MIEGSEVCTHASMDSCLRSTAWLDAVGKETRDKVGKTLEVDADDDGSGIGGYLIIKVRLDIRKALLRGV
jgi:hypothetical protein